MDTHQSRQSMIDAMAPPTPREDDSEAAMSDRPVLAVIPLPARLEVTAAVLGALADVWEDHHGQVLTMSDAPEESTPWGRALVIREPGPPAGPADGEVAPDTEKGALTPPLPTALAASIECVLLDHVDELDDDAGCVDANLAELAFVYRSLTGWDAKTETAVADDLAEARRRAERAEADRQRLLNLLGDLADEDPCQFDHHGGCQAHGYLWLAGGERCPQAVAQEILAANPAPGERDRRTADTEALDLLDQALQGEHGGDRRSEESTNVNNVNVGRPVGNAREAALREIPPGDPAAASPDRAVQAVLGHRWGSAGWSAHSRHRYDSECAVCQGDVAAILAVAAPLIAGGGDG